MSIEKNDTLLFGAIRNRWGAGGVYFVVSLVVTSLSVVYNHPLMTCLNLVIAGSSDIFQGTFWGGAGLMALLVVLAAAKSLKGCRICFFVLCGYWLVISFIVTSRFIAMNTALVR